MPSGTLELMASPFAGSPPGAGTRSYNCDSCEHPPFDSSEKLKNHRRTHAPQCTVKYPSSSGPGLEEIITLHRSEVDQLFSCSRCMVYANKSARKMQMHGRKCAADSEPRPPSSGIDAVAIPDSDGPRDRYICSDLDFVINQVLRIAICRPCAAWVEFGEIGGHASRRHRRRVDAGLLGQDLLHFQLEGDLERLDPYYTRGSTDLKVPIDGLPVYHGWRCTSCAFYAKCEDRLRRHVREEHADAGTSCMGRCSVQRLSQGPGSNSWFGVTTSPGQDGPGDGRLLDIVARDAAEREAAASVPSFGDPRLLPPWLKQLNWDSFILGMDVDVEAMRPWASAKHGADDRFFPDRLREVCSSLMKDFQRIIGSAESLLRKKVKSTSEVETCRVPFYRLEQSSEEYVGTMSHLLIILLRSLDAADGTSDTDGGDVLKVMVPLGDDVLRGSLRALWDGLRAQAAEGDGQRAVDRLGESKSHCIRVLEDLFLTTRPSHTCPVTSLLVYRFVVFVAIESSRTLTPDDVTHRIARMMYWCRSLVLYKIVNAPVVEVGDADEAEERLLLFVREGERTPFGAILDSKRIVNHATANDTTLPKVVWVGDDQVVDGTTVSIRGVSTLVLETIRELDGELKRDILLDMPAYDSNRAGILHSKSGGPLEDNLSDTEARAWFVSNKRNRCSDHTLDLVRHIVGDVRLCARFVERVDETGAGRIVWRRDALKEWMHTVGKWLQKLLSIVHLVAGQPARGVELLACGTRNTTAQPRGVYYVDGLVMLLTLYGKADGQRGRQQPVARFLDRGTSVLLVSYLTYVREMEIVASGVLHTEDATARYGQLLAVKGGQAMSSRELSKGMDRMFLTHLKVSVTLGPWRHMAVAWMHRFLGYTSVSELTANGAVDSQAGHSQRVASQRYGRSNFDHPSIGRDELQQYRKVSEQWHTILGLGGAGSSHLPPRPGAAAGPHKPGRIPPSPGAQDSGIRSRRRVRPEEDPLTLQTTGAEVHHHHHHHHEVKVVQARGDVGTGFPSLACSELALRGLLAFGHTKFKSWQQADATQRILQREEDLLVVLPTGGGKTLLFLLPALLEAGRYTTVVICPFVALRKEVERRAREGNVSVQVYSESESACLGSADILLASAEHCGSTAFQNHLALLHGGDRLARIVVDECHVAVTATAWRPAMRHLRAVRVRPVPLLLLSATVPSELEEKLREFFNVRPSVIRSATNRPNMTYAVEKGGLPMNVRVENLLRALQGATGIEPPKSIVFCRYRDDTKKLSEHLVNQGFSSTYYHGQMGETDRIANHNSWVRGADDIMVATGAFGTGVDLGAVRVVVHVGEPYSMIDLAQESGRGGRDGLESKHIIFLPLSWRATAETSPELAEYLGGSKCRRLVLQECVDGSGLDCFVSGSRPCDVCESRAAGLRGLSGEDPTDSLETGDCSTNMGAGQSEMDLTGGTDGNTSSSPPVDDGSPAKRMRLPGALSHASASGTLERRAFESMSASAVLEFLTEAKGRCVLCTVAYGRSASRSEHAMSRCPGLVGRCIRCLGQGHSASGGGAETRCENRTTFDKTITCCYGCGLPNMLGGCCMHPEPFGTTCDSIGRDKIVPACWHLWRDPEKYDRVLTESNCPRARAEDFASWLGRPHVTHTNNAVHLFSLYVDNLEGSR